MTPRRKVERVLVRYASDCEECPDCGEPWCQKCREHYADCSCLGPGQLEDGGWTPVMFRGRLYGTRPKA